MQLRNSEVFPPLEILLLIHQHSRSIEDSRWRCSWYSTFDWVHYSATRIKIKIYCTVRNILLVKQNPTSYCMKQKGKKNWIWKPIYKHVKYSSTLLIVNNAFCRLIISVWRYVRSFFFSWVIALIRQTTGLGQNIPIRRRIWRNLPLKSVH